MSISSDFHALGKFYADHPELPAPRVTVLLRDVLGTRSGKVDETKRIADFLDGYDDVTVEPLDSQRSALVRQFGSIGVRGVVSTEAVYPHLPESFTAVPFTAAQLRQRATVSQPELGGPDLDGAA